MANAGVGGAAARLGGGKFADGAVTGAFQRLFNHEMHPDRYSANDDNYHHYEVWTAVCKYGAPTCSPEELIYVLLRYNAPGQDPNNPALDGEVTSVAYGAGDVYHTVDWANFRVSNWTLPNHILHDGVIDRMLVVKEGMVYIYTHGEGTGAYARMNEIYGSALFSTIDQTIKSVVNKNYIDYTHRQRMRRWMGQ